ncbi:MAG: 23S rRNA (pseudouridine(1915)-N(3))-methyltransferase RlmH [Lawsonibacter sp.]|nr:23S rRNA (pseudouridine(1915)-N(3))-methyltransferase RlmH [Lawsonibacter sp.]
MLSVHLICVGKLKEKYYKDACAEYSKRLSPYCKLTLTEIPEAKLPKNPTLGEITAALEKEGDAIRAKIPPSSRVVALCIEGRLRSSEELPRMFPVPGRSQDKHIVFLIGGSYGLHPSIKAEAQSQLSMSPMTFPHHLARVMLLEQLYRAFKIEEGSAYHK